MHRPKYDDWSFPKGKVDPGEHVTSAAVREVAEETGLDVRLGAPLPPQHYTVRNGVEPREGRALLGRSGRRGRRRVAATGPTTRSTGRLAARSRRPPRRLTYERDRATLDAFLAARAKTMPLVVLRHGKATARKELEGRRP